MQRSHGDVQQVASGVFQGQEFGGQRIDCDGSQAAVAANAMVDMDDRGARVQVSQVAKYLFRIADPALTPSPATARRRAPVP